MELNVPGVELQLVDDLVRFLNSEQSFQGPVKVDNEFN